MKFFKIWLLVMMNCVSAVGGIIAIMLAIAHKSLLVGAIGGLIAGWCLGYVPYLINQLEEVL